MELIIQKSNMLIYIVLLTYLKPINVTLIEPLDKLYKLLKIAATIILLFEVIKKKIKISKTCWWCILFLSIWSVSIFLNNGSLAGNTQSILSIVGIMILYMYSLNEENGICRLIIILSNIAKIYIIFNFITVLLNRPLFATPKISYVKYFLGSDNYFAFILIPLCGFIFINDLNMIGRIKVSSWIIAFVGLLSLIIPFSVTGMFTLGVYLFVMIFVNFPQIKKYFTIKNVIVFSALFLLIIMIPNVQRYLKTAMIVGKNGLNSRETIWPLAMSAIIKKPILGYGALTEKQISDYILYGTSHAHNILLEFLLNTGIIGSTVAGIWSYSIFKDLFEVRDKIVECLLLCIAAYVLCGVFDFYMDLIYFWLLIFSLDFYKKYKLKKQI